MSDGHIYGRPTMGRSVQEFIAKRVGWTWNADSVWTPSRSIYARHPRGTDILGELLPDFQGSFAAAWTIVEYWLREEGRSFSLHADSYSKYCGVGFAAQFREKNEESCGCRAATPEEAICKAFVNTIHLQD